MKFIFAICLSFIFFVGCKKEEPVAELDTQIVKNEVIEKPAVAHIDTSVLAGKWLKIVVEEYFDNFQKLKGSYKHICTPQYAAMKWDASNVDLPGGLSEEAFVKKYGPKDLEYKGLRETFMIASSEFGKVVVANYFVKEVTPKGYLINASIQDQTFGSRFLREVHVIKSGNTFLIDNILELENNYSGQLSAL